MKGVAGFHSGLGTARPGDAKDIKAKVLVCIGADDPMIGPDARQAFVDEMTAGKVDWQMHLYGGVVHSFTNKRRLRAACPMPSATVRKPIRGRGNRWWIC